MDMDEVTIQQLQRALTRGEVTSVELVTAYLTRISALDKSGPCLQAVATVNQDALEQAAAADRHLRKRNRPQGALHGVPLVLKDNIDTAGLRTTYGSQTATNNVPSTDAAIVSRLRAAGAIVLAKTAMADFGASWFSASSLTGLTKNPYALDHDSGGSSGGTAAVVAANMAAAGIGGDTGGSVRVPASFCNLVGLRVTTGLISRLGIAPLVSVQDTAGPMTRTVTDAAILLDCLAGSDARDPQGLPEDAPYSGHLSSGTLRGLRIGVLSELVDSQTADLGEVFAQALAVLSSAGACLVSVSLPTLPALLRDSSLYLESSRSELDCFIASTPGIDAEGIAEIHRNHAYHPALDLLEAIALSEPRPNPLRLKHKIKMRAKLYDEVTGLMDDKRLNVLAFPDVQVPPPTHRDVMAGRWSSLTYPTNTILASQAGLPAISLPMGFTRDGLPLGLEFVARQLQEGPLLAWGRAAELALPMRRPPAPGWEIEPPQVLGRS